MSQNEPKDRQKSPENTGKPYQNERNYTLSISEDDRQTSFQIEDERWQRSQQIKDWLKLGAMVLVTLLWSLMVYFFVPGLR